MSSYATGADWANVLHAVNDFYWRGRKTTQRYFLIRHGVYVLRSKLPAQDFSECLDHGFAYLYGPAGTQDEESVAHVISSSSLLAFSQLPPQTVGRGWERFFEFRELIAGPATMLNNEVISLLARQNRLFTTFIERKIAEDAGGRPPTLPRVVKAELYGMGFPKDLLWRYKELLSGCLEQ